MPDEPFEPVTAPEPAPEPAPAASWWEDFIDIFYSPSSVFERRKGQPWWPMLIIVAVATALLFFLFHRTGTPLFDLEMQHRMASGSQQLTPEQMENVRKFAGISGSVGTLIVLPIKVVIIALLLWGLGRAFGAVSTFSNMMMVATYSQIVLVLQMLVAIVQTLVLNVNGMDSMHDISLGLDRFLNQPAASNTILALSGRVELFILWATILLAIGLHTVTKIPKARAYAVAFLIWALGTLPGMLGGLMGGAR